MTTPNKDIVLACHVYIDDGWYGDNHRVILSNEFGKGFKNKTEAKKFTVRLRKYTQNRFAKYGSRLNEITNDNIRSGEYDSFEEYIYCGSGPSNVHKHHYISVADLSK